MRVSPVFSCKVIRVCECLAWWSGSSRSDAKECGEIFHDSIHVRYLYTNGSFQLPNAKDNEGIVRYHIQKAIRSAANCSPPVTLVVHGGSDLAETSNVGTTDERWELALGRGEVLLGGTQAVLEAVLHDALELLVDLLCGP